MFMREHTYETYDHWFYNGILSTSGSFFDIGKVMYRYYKPIPPPPPPNYNPRRDGALVSSTIFRSILW
jgi:hypothetical protein